MSHINHVNVTLNELPVQNHISFAHCFGNLDKLDKHLDEKQTKLVQSMVFYVALFRSGLGKVIDRSLQFTS